MPGNNASVGQARFRHIFPDRTSFLAIRNLAPGLFQTAQHLVHSLSKQLARVCLAAPWAITVFTQYVRFSSAIFCRTCEVKLQQPLSRTTMRNRRNREFYRELWILSKKLTGIYFQIEDFALFCCAL